MNCVQGDLAIINKNLRSGSPNAGKIVRCLRWTEASLVLPDVKTTSGRIVRIAKPCWEIDVPIVRWFDDDSTAMINYVPDEALTPIRDNGEEDETLTWKTLRKENT